MGIPKALSASANIKVVAFCDSGVSVSREVYESYLETLNEELLELKEEPTRFELKTVLSFDQQTKLDNKISVNRETQNAIISSGSLQEIRAALVNIEDPEGNLVFKKDGDGLASKELIAQLASAEILPDLAAARNFARVGTKHLQKK